MKVSDLVKSHSVLFNACITMVTQFRFRLRNVQGGICCWVNQTFFTLHSLPSSMLMSKSRSSCGMILRISIMLMFLPILQRA